jgi:hypothetical protein
MSNSNTTGPTGSSRSLAARLGILAEAWRPAKGDTLVGEVVDIDDRSTDYGEPYKVVTVRTDEGAEFAVHAFHTVLRREMKKRAPQIGDKIGIAYHGQSEPAKAGLSGAHLYKVVVDRDERPPAVDWESTPATGDDFVPPADDDIPF